MASQLFETLHRQYEAGDPAAAPAIVALADTGDPDALFKAAGFRLLGIVGNVDVETACKLMKAAARTGHVEARRAIAYFTAAGLGTKPDPAKARKMLENAASDDRFVAVQLAFLKYVQCAARLKTAERKTISANPQVELIHALFGPEECRYVQMLAKPWLKPAKVYSESGGSRLDPLRDAKSMAFVPMAEDLVIQSINHCIAAAAGFPVAWGEPLHVMHYGPGQQFRPHHDANGPGRGNRRRIATALLYLNDDYAGGETDFPELEIRVRGSTGDLLVFHNMLDFDVPDPRLVHAGMPVISGEKWLATRWIRGCNFFGGR